MKFKKPVNENYCATVVEIKNVVQLDNCDNIQGTIIFGNNIIIGKDVKVGDVGIYFPAETQLSHEYVSNNNLYRHAELNVDPEKKGYIEDNKRIRTMKLRGNKSCGLFMPLTSLEFCIDVNDLQIGDSFDEIKGTPICNKYVVVKRNAGQGNKGKKAKAKKESKLIDGQFRFHEDTAQFGKNAHRFGLNDIMSITYKVHGTSLVVSNVICKKKIGWFYKLLRWFGVKVVDFQYDNVYSSRKSIKNDEIQAPNNYYEIDIWGLANNKLKEYLFDGMTVYAEIVGHLPNGSFVQKGYDYGCDPKEWETYIYRITYTNPSGNVFEFSAKQVQDWCKERGLKAVPELYYGTVKGFVEKHMAAPNYDARDFPDQLIKVLRDVYLEGDCYMCKNKLPAEGIVVRKEANTIDAYKLKSFRFLARETKMLDKGEADIEEDN